MGHAGKPWFPLEGFATCWKGIFQAFLSYFDERSRAEFVTFPSFLDSDK